MLERRSLEQLLERLRSRLRRDFEEGRPLTHVLQEIERIANRNRDLRVAIEWTLQQISVSGTRVGIYLAHMEQLSTVASILEVADSPEIRLKVDKLHEAKKETEKLIENIYWAQDLLFPEIKVPSMQNEPEEEI